MAFSTFPLEGKGMQGKLKELMQLKLHIRQLIQLTESVNLLLKCHYSGW
jgi:hypothetical protein